MKIDIMGVQFDSVTMAEALDTAEKIITQGKPSYVVTPNPEIVYETMHDPDFAQLIGNAAMILPDGIGIIYAGKILKTPLKQKLPGVDFATNLLELMAKKGYRLFLFGSKPGVAQLAADKMLATTPTLEICGISDGYFQDEAAKVAEIRAAKPHVLFVCLGSPKQEHFMSNYLEQLQIPLMVGLGGTLDAVAGTVKRAPGWMQKLGLEWFYRLIKEPKRYKRMLRLPKFLWAVVKKRLKGGTSWAN